MKKIEKLKNGGVLYKSHRTEPYFTFIKNGIKTIEGRIKKGLYQELKIGDEIIIFNNKESDSVHIKVKNVRNYISFENLLINEGIKKVLPDIDSIEEGINIYKKFYTEEQETEFRIIAIEIELI